MKTAQNRINMKSKYIAKITNNAIFIVTKHNFFVLKKTHRKIVRLFILQYSQRRTDMLPVPVMFPHRNHRVNNYYGFFFTKQ